MGTVTLTKHAYDRLKERAGVNRKTAERLCEKAYRSGISSTDVRGSLRRYMADAYSNSDKEGFEAKIYGDFMYCFVIQEESVLVLTAFWVPKNLRNQSLAAQRKKAA